MISPVIYNENPQMPRNNIPIYNSLVIRNIYENRIKWLLYS